MAPRRPPAARLRFDALEERNLLNAADILVSAAAPVATPLAASWDLLGPDLYRVTLAAGVGATRAAAELGRLPGVNFAEADAAVHAAGTPNDTFFGYQWALHNAGAAGADINAPAAWNLTTGTGKTVVAVIDSGVDVNDADLVGNIWTNPTANRDGYVGDVHGWNYVGNSGNVADDNGHGTFVAGTIAATGDNGYGVAGVDWHAQIMVLKFLDGTGNGSLSNAVQAIYFAVNHGAKIINGSWGAAGSYAALDQAVAYARANGVIVVAAAGNSAANNDATHTYLASSTLDNVVAVAATDRTDALASYSNYGPATVALASPGTQILGLLPNNGLAYYTGTSMAAPLVTGALALVWDYHPTWTYAQVIAAVETGVDKLPGLAGKVKTGGRLDLYKALTYGAAPTPAGRRHADSGRDAGPGGDAGRGQDVRLDGRQVDLRSRLRLLGPDDSGRDNDLQAHGQPQRHARRHRRRLGVARGPDGTTVLLIYHRGGSGRNFTNTTLADAAATELWLGTGTFTGTYRPDYALSAFHGKSTQGTWYLILQNIAGTDAGTIASWSLTATGGAAVTKSSLEDAPFALPASEPERPALDGLQAVALTPAAFFFVGEGGPTTFAVPQDGGAKPVEAVEAEEVPAVLDGAVPLPVNGAAWRTWSGVGLGEDRFDVTVYDEE